MKLTLKNFKCYANKKFILPDTGLVLLDGPSGSGKSTVLKAIVFALYGVCKNPCSFGSTTCYVKLSFMGLKIKRTHRPCRLLVNDVEDAVAQHLINEKIMNYEQFMISSYVPQKKNSCILAMTPMQKLELLRTISLSESGEIYKNRLEQMIKNGTMQISNMNSVIEGYKSCQKEIKLEPIDFPLGPIKNGHTENSVLQTYYSRVAKFNSRLEKLTKKREKCLELLNNLKATNLEINLLESQVTQLNCDCTKLLSRKKQLDANSVSPPGKDINLLQKQREYLIATEKLSELKKRYALHKKNISDTMQQKISEIKSELWFYNGNKLYQQEAQKQISDYTAELCCIKQTLEHKSKIDRIMILSKGTSDWKKSVDKIQSLVDQYTALLANLEKKLTENKTRGKTSIHQCPHCQKTVYYCDQELYSKNTSKQINNETLEAEIQETSEKLKASHKTLQELYSLKPPDNYNPDVKYENVTEKDCQEIEEKISKLSAYISLNLNREHEITVLKNTVPNNKIFQDEISCLKSTVSKLVEYKCDPGTNLEQLEKDIENISIQKHVYDSIMDELHHITSQVEAKKIEKQNIMTTIWQLKENILGQRVETCQSNLDDVESALLKLRTRQSEDSNIAELVDKYTEYKKALAEYKKWQDKIDDCTDDLEELEKNLEACKTAKKRYSQAEVISMDNTINNINQYTGQYTRKFFDQNITTDIIMDKTGTKVDTLLVYKGSEYSIHDLSGGEYDRCILASVCGVNNLLDSPFLILDESLTSLDSEINTDILSVLRELGSNKLILVCSHNSVHGIFDTVISL